jgi:hypothetical protein
MVRCPWDRTDDQAAEQTAHPTAVRAGGRVFNSNRCTQIDEEPTRDTGRMTVGFQTLHEGDLEPKLPGDAKWPGPPCVWP